MFITPINIGKMRGGKEKKQKSVVCVKKNISLLMDIRIIKKNNFK